MILNLVVFSLLVFNASLAPDVAPPPPKTLYDWIFVDDSLPAVFNKNELARSGAGVEIVGNCLAAGKNRVRMPAKKDEPGENLAVQSICHPASARIVRVALGRRNKESLLGRILEFATVSTPAPVLMDVDGKKYFAMGYGILFDNRADFLFNLDANRPLLTLSQIEVGPNAGLGALTDKDEVILYYQVPAGIKLVYLDISKEKKKIDPFLNVK